VAGVGREKGMGWEVEWRRECGRGSDEGVRAEREVEREGGGGGRLVGINSMTSSPRAGSWYGV
jgi:hypothetical protein